MSGKVILWEITCYQHNDGLRWCIIGGGAYSSQDIKLTLCLVMLFSFTDIQSLDRKYNQKDESIAAGCRSPKNVPNTPVIS